MEVKYLVTYNLILCRTLLKCANQGSRREPCANLGSRRELKIISLVRAANHFQKLVNGANQNYFHRLAPRTKFKTLLVAQTKNVFTGSRRKPFSKIYLWREPKFFHRFAPRTIFKNLLVARTKIFFTDSRSESFSKICLWSKPEIFS